jgi:hypothetical protein
MLRATITEADLDCVLHDSIAVVRTIRRRTTALNRFFHWASRQPLRSWSLIPVQPMAS